MTDPTNPNGPPPATRLERADEGLSITEAADLIGVHYQTIRNWIQRGQLPYTEFGPQRPGARRIVRIAREDVLAMRTAHPRGA